MPKDIVYEIVECLIEAGMTEQQAEDALLRIQRKGIFFGQLTESGKAAADLLMKLKGFPT